MWHAHNIINIQPKVSLWSYEEAQKATLDIANFNSKYKLSYNCTTTKTWELPAGAGSLIYVLKPFGESTQTLNLFLLPFPCQAMPVLIFAFPETSPDSFSHVPFCIKTPPPKSSLLVTKARNIITLHIRWDPITSEVQLPRLNKVQVGGGGSGQSWRFRGVCHLLLAPGPPSGCLHLFFQVRDITRLARISDVAEVLEVTQ